MIRKHAKKLELFFSHLAVNISRCQHPWSTYWIVQCKHRIIVSHRPLFITYQNGVLRSLTAQNTATALTAYWCFLYDPPKKLLANNRKQFTLRFYTGCCCALGTANVYITTYNPQTNGQAKRFNCTLLTALCHYVAKHHGNWDEFTDALTYAYSTRPSSSSSFASFKLVLAHPPSTLALEACPVIMREQSARHWYLHWKHRLSVLINTSDQQLLDAQVRYKRRFDAWLRRVADNVLQGNLVFVETALADQLHELAPVVRGPFPDVS